MQYPAHFQSKKLTSWLLVPLSALYCVVTAIRRFFYRVGLFSCCKPPVPVIVVGNVTVGGTGKTPIVILLIDMLREMGFNPGVISRGYGRTTNGVRSVTPESTAQQVGDEPLMIHLRTACPMVVAASRCDAVQLLLDMHPEVDVIISDDGMQHYALQRDVEIAVVDSSRHLGNGFCLPAGPLREPAGRLNTVDYVLYNGGEGAGVYFQMVASAVSPLLKTNSQLCSLDQLRGKTIHAVAGIGNPERFFRLLEQAEIVVQRHVFPDHHCFSAEDICFNDELAVLMTEKDAVKCRQFATDRHWYLMVDAVLPEPDFVALQQILRRKLNG